MDLSADHSDNFSQSDDSDDDSSLSGDDTDIRMNENDNVSADESEVPLSERWKDFISDLTWTENGMFVPTVHPFSDPNSRIQSGIHINKRCTPAEIFKLFFTDDIIEMICHFTNAYQEKKLSTQRLSGKLKQSSKMENTNL